MRIQLSPRLKSDVERAASKKLQVVAQSICDEIQKYTRSSVTVSKKKEGEYEIGVPTHLVYVSEGTRPHKIRPIRAKVLRFTSGGVEIFAREVDHPGIRPRKILDSAIQRGIAKVEL